MLAASLKSKENIGPSDDPNLAKGAVKIYFIFSNITSVSVACPCIELYLIMDVSPKNFFISQHHTVGLFAFTTSADTISNRLKNSL